MFITNILYKKNNKHKYLVLIFYKMYATIILVKGGFMLLDGFWTEIGSLFTQMHWAVILLLGLGVVLCIIEAVVTGFGFFGIAGIICEIAGVVTHAVISGSAAQVLFLLILLVLVMVLITLLFVRSAKYGLLSKSAIVENKTAIPTDYKEKEEKKLSGLIGKEGLTLTECRPVGKIRIGDDTYEAQSRTSIIEKGEVIKVVAVEDARLVIDKITY